MTGYFYAPRRKTSLPSRWIFCWMHLRPVCTVRRSLRRRAPFWPRALQPAASRSGYPVSAAWNRDGLALRAAGDLLQFAPGPAPRHLLIVLTDASPNDSRRIPPSPEKPLGCGYEDAAGVADTAAQVRALQRMGIRVSAVFMGEDSSAGAAAQIYGKNMARIRGMDQLARAAGRLIQNEIRELGD